MTEPGSPVGAGADAHAGVGPDEALVRAVAGALAVNDGWYDVVEDEQTGYDCAHREWAAARVALAAAGRVLAGTLDERAQQSRYYGRPGRAEGIEDAAKIILAACGVPEEGS